MTASHIVCPKCSATNRIPQERLGDQPKCGKCKTPLFQGMPINLDDASFEKHINSNDIPVVVDFWSSSCAPCKMMGPEFQKASAQLEPNARFAKVNVGNAQQAATRFDIRSVPTMIIFKNGQEIARQSGALHAAQIAQWVKKIL
ncbi:MAG: Thioredoxin [uncultured Thiotrichaceae bacterium]|uniref:Thioredoxin n=1 Tax=uncultured Thiotrichaceae bacterium TaxID=298394 RepID=A0A6S6U0Y7_9GAMM|nr:MAG: Thioredoxin [uncultured Thiotrichaceae bacterium]